MAVEDDILGLMPYRRPFLFVDRFKRIDENGATGQYRYRDDEFFYTGHFPEQPVTPGVILIETMAQIGLVGLGIYLTGIHLAPRPLRFAFAESEVIFLARVDPGERVTVRSEKVYFRLGKLKCRVEMINEAKTQVCHGTLSGVVLGEETS